MESQWLEEMEKAMDSINSLTHSVSMSMMIKQFMWLISTNDRIVEWKKGAASGQVVAGGKGQGNRSDQLSCPINVMVEKKNDALIICDAKKPASGAMASSKWHKWRNTDFERCLLRFEHGQRWISVCF